MTVEWTSTTLGAAGRWVSGGTPATSNESYWGGETPWMSSKSLTSFRIRDSERRLSELGAKSGTKLVPKDTILMVVRGMSLKSEFRMGITQREVALSQDLKGLIPRSDIDATFLAYALQSRSDDVLDMVDEAGHGTGRLQTDRLFALELALPPRAEQEAIAATLGVLDDKIESNQRAVLMELELAALLLRRGEDLVRLGDIAQLDKGLSYKGSGLDDGTTPGAIPMLNLASFTAGSSMNSGGVKHYTGVFKPKHRLSAWSLIVANTDLTQNRGILGRALLVPSRLDGALHTHHTSHLRFERCPKLRLVAWAQLQSPQFRERAKGFATGTTVTALPPEAVLDFTIAVPNDLEASLTRASLLIERAWTLEDETACLTMLRRALLSELRSGRLRLPAEGEAL